MPQVACYPWTILDKTPSPQNNVCSSFNLYGDCILENLVYIKTMQKQIIVHLHVKWS